MWVADCPITLLSELRPLTRQDLVKNGKRVVPRTFYVHGFHREDVLEQHEIESSPSNFVEKWLPWIQAKRLFVPKEKETVTEPKQDLLV